MKRLFQTLLLVLAAISPTIANDDTGNKNPLGNYSNAIVLQWNTIACVKEYIDKNFLDPASLESLTRDFGLNEFKLKSGFKKMFDTSPIRYLQSKRLVFALSLLRDTNKSIKEIAHQIGYSHAANFTNAFVKKFGQAPERYRGR